MKKPVAPVPVKGGPGAGVNPGGLNRPAPAPPAVKAPAGRHQAKAKAKPAKVSRAVHAARHKAALKAAATRKKNAAKAKKLGLALGEGVACCAAEALAASLRLTGWPVSDADVLALYELTADGPDDGASIVATLEAAAEYGLAGVQPLSFGEVMPYGPLAATLCETRAGLILGADLPGPHAVLADGGAWWSWGEPYDPDAFPRAVIEECWKVTW